MKAIIIFFIACTQIFTWYLCDLIPLRIKRVRRIHSDVIKASTNWYSGCYQIPNETKRERNKWCIPISLSIRLCFEGVGVTMQIYSFTFQAILGAHGDNDNIDMKLYHAHKVWMEGGCAQNELQQSSAGNTFISNIMP